MVTISTDRMIAGPDCDAIAGQVVWQPAKSVWTLAMTATGLMLAPVFVTPGAVAVFLALTAVTICAGHSVGMHRLLIHRSFEAPKWVEYIMVYLGTLVGMAGPFGMIAAHDIRDWAQRQRDCHDLYAHRRFWLRDMWWQMHCAVRLDHPPRFEIEPEIASDPVYRFLERTWMLQQVPVAVALYLIGGLPWVIWGVPLRVAFSLTGHWLVGHLAHRRGTQGWTVDGVAVQGYNVPFASLITFGESWHGNHHAFPGSARLGVEAGQADPGWWLLKVLKAIGLVHHLREPQDVGERDGLRRLTEEERWTNRPRPSLKPQPSGRSAST